MASYSSPRTDLPDPTTPGGLARTFDGYRRWLQTRTPEQLAAELTRINAAMQEQSRSLVTSQVSPPLSAWTSQLDQPVIRSGPTGPLSPWPRDLASDPSRPSQPRPPAERYSRSPMLGALIAARLARSSSTRR